MSKTPSSASLLEKRDRAFLTTVFKGVDRDKTGRINAAELQRALANGSWRPFGEELVYLMVRMFDRSFSGTISMEQFFALWDHITTWISCFKKHSKGCRVDKAELQSAMAELGYRLSPGLCAIMIRRFDQMGDYRIGLEDFLRLCVVLYDAAEVFGGYDPDKTGTARVTYDDFLTVMFTMSK